MKLDQKFFHSLKNILSSMGKEHYQEIVDREMKSYMAPEIRIGMWGQFSCGKSSFINALIGRKLLPVNILELTSMVTEVVYGEKDQIILNPESDNLAFDYSEEMAAIAMAGIKSWDELKPSMRTNLDEQRFASCLTLFKKLESPLEKVKLSTPASILKNGLVFVDLPGLSGTADHSKLTSGRINECQMVLYLNAPSRPIDSHDWEIIKKLRSEGRDRVVFGVRTKSDDLFKIHYAESGTEMKDEDRYKLFLNEFKKEIKDISFDDYFLVSPLAFSAISDAGGDYQLATKTLKEEHKNKFRFLHDDSKIEIISGFQYFSNHFEKSIESKRDEAKIRKVKSTIFALLGRISQEIHEEWNVMSSSKRMDESERKVAKEELERIKAKFQPLRNIRGRYDDLIDFQLRGVVGDICFESMKRAVQAANPNSNYASPEHVIEFITGRFQDELRISLDTKQFGDRIQAIGSSALSEYRDNLVLIEDLLNEFDQELLKESQDGLSLEKINLDKFDLRVDREMAAATAPAYLGSVAGGLLGGMIIDSSMSFVMESVMGAFAGFGVGTIMVGAFRGILNGRGAINGILDGIGDFFHGLGALFGVQSSKATLLCKTLQTPKGQTDLARSLSGQVTSSIHMALKRVLVEKVTTTLEKQNTLTLMWNRFESAEKKLQTLYSNKDKDLKQREKELKELLEMEASYTSLLNEYGLGETKIKKAA